MNIERETLKNMNKYTYTPRRISPRKTLVLRHKAVVRTRLARFAIITSITLIILGLSAITFTSASERQVAKDCAIEKRTLADYPLKNPDTILIQECKQRDLW